MKTPIFTGPFAIQFCSSPCVTIQFQVDQALAAKLGVDDYGMKVQVVS